MGSFFHALNVANSVHQDQLDIGGQHYILHPIRVAVNVKTEFQKVCALLHDVLEDSKCHTGLEYVIGLYFTEFDTYEDEYKVLKVVKILTRLPNEPYQDYIERVGEDKDATIIKLADLEDNMDVKRLIVINDADLKRMRKYQKAYNYLKEKVNDA